MRENMNDKSEFWSTNKTKNIGQKSSLFRRTRLEKEIEKLKLAIKEEFYPEKLQTPFTVRSVLQSSKTSEMILISADGRYCKYILHSEEQTIQNLPNTNEILFASLFDDDHLLIAELNKFFLISISQTSKKEFSDTFQSPFIAGSVNDDKFFIMQYEGLFIFDLNDYSYSQVKTFWGRRSPLAMEVKSDENSIYIILTTSKRYYIFDGNETRIIHKERTIFPCSMIKVSKSFLVLGSEKSISIFDWENLKEIKKIKYESGLFRSISVSPSEKFLAIGLDDGEAKVYSLAYIKQSKLVRPKSYLGSSGPKEYTMFTDDDVFITHCTREKKIMIYKVPPDTSVAIKRIVEKEIGFFRNVGNFNLVIIHFIGHGIVFKDAETLEDMYTYLIDSELFISLSSDCTKLLVLQNNWNGTYSRVVIDLADLSFNKNPPIHIPEVALFFTRSVFNDIILSFANGEITLYNEQTFERIRGCPLHKKSPTALAFTSSQTVCISGDIDGNVYVFDLDTFSIIGALKKHSSEISQILVYNDDSKTLCVSSDGVMKISDLESRNCINSIESLPGSIKRMHMSKDEKYLMTSFIDKGFYVLDIRSCTLVAQQKHISDYLLFEDDKYFAIIKAGMSLIYKVENPLKTTQLRTIGPVADDIEYYKYIYKILSNKEVEYNKDYDNYLIIPFFLNVLHVYAYGNNQSLMKLALENNAYFAESRYGNTPLSICIEKKFLLMDHLIEYLLVQVPGNCKICYFFRDCLQEINQIGTQHLVDLYNTLFQKIEPKGLPSVCSKSMKLPITKNTQEFYLLSKRFFFPKERKMKKEEKTFKTEIEKKNERYRSVLYTEYPENDLSKIENSQRDIAIENIGEVNIEYRQLLCEMNFEYGSSESINFLESLLHCPFEDIFRTPFVQLLLKHKWKKAQFPMFLIGIIYGIYTFLLILHLCYISDSYLLALTLFFSLLLSAYEIWQMVVMGRGYFQSVMNIKDILRSVAFLLYSIGIFADVYDQKNNRLMTIVLLLTFLRGISFFSLFESTRTLTALIYEVVKEMLAFIVIFTYSIIAFASIYISYSEESEINLYDYFLQSYDTSLGNFSATETEVEQSWILLLATVFNTIVMLNLLISIIGDTFDRVRDRTSINDGRIVLTMIIEAENLLIWKRNRNNKKFFTACVGDGQSEDHGEVWEGKLRTIINHIDSTKSQVSELESTLTNSVKMFKEDMKESIRKEFNEFKQNMKDEFKEEINSLKYEIGGLKNSLLEALEEIKARNN